MTISAAVKKKIYNLIEVYDELYSSLANINDELVTDLIKGWSATRIKYKSILDGDINLPRPSAVPNGMQQGLRDFPLLFLNHPNDTRKSVYEKYFFVMKKNDYTKNITNESLTNILKRGRINNEFEYYAVRQAIDAAEFLEKNEDLIKLMTIINLFEST